MPRRWIAPRPTVVALVLVTALSIPTALAIPPASSASASPTSVSSLPAGSPVTSAPGGGPTATGVPPPPAGVQFAPSHPVQTLASLQASVDSTRSALASAQKTKGQAQANLSIALEGQSQAAAQLAGLRGRQYQAALALVAAKDRIKNLAINDFLAGGNSQAELAAVLQSGNLDQLGQRQEYVSALSHTLQSDVSAFRDAERAAQGAARPAADNLLSANNSVTSAQSALTAATTTESQAQANYQTAQDQLSLTTLAAPAPGTDIPQIVLNAYEHAANVFATRDPSCQISWADMAALGRIESGQAQHGMTRLAANGDTYPPILGPPLDGSGGNAALPQPPNLPYYDGPGPWEQAVGPMQFIPTSWATSGLVGGSNSTPDPNNVFDAAMGAANYLCRAAAGQSLTTLSGLTQAYFSYNHSATYVSEALSNAVYYGATINPPPTP